MAIIFYDVDGNIVNNHDTEDKPYWCSEGETKEHAFVRMWGDQIQYSMNPDKVTNKFVPDLISRETNVPADLKSQHTPFFTAKKNYGIEPGHAVVFNVKDKLRYEELYPGIDIIYYINWIAVKADIHGKIYNVNPFMGIYKVPFRKLLLIFKKENEHTYQRRKNDQRGNAKSSYLFDIREAGGEQLV